MAERIAYGRRIQDEATQLLTAFGVDAIGKAEQEAQAPGLTATDRAFRQAVLARVARLLGEKKDSAAA
ncbi:MAG: hypothetical protein AAGG56_02415 [Pseudomonadota bacterium]